MARVVSRILNHHYQSDARTLPLLAVMSHAQDSVIPETTHASGASKSLQSASVVDLAEDVIEFEIVTYNNKKSPADKAYATTKRAVEKGAGKGRTNITLLNPLTCNFSSFFQISCSMCNLECRITNPLNFWGSPLKKCKHGVNVGQVLLHVPGAIILLDGCV